METTNLLLPSTRVARTNEWKREAEDAVLITEQPTKRSPFIEANTTEVTLEHLRNDCIIPTFAKDNEVCISHLCLSRFYDTKYASSCGGGCPGSG